MINLPHSLLPFVNERDVGSDDECNGHGNANSSFQSNDLNDLDYEASDDADQVFCPTNSGGGVILVSCSTN